MNIISAFMNFLFWFLDYKIPFGGYEFSLSSFIIWGALAGIVLYVAYFFRSE